MTFHHQTCSKNLKKHRNIETQKRKEGFDNSVSLDSQSDCLLRCSQSCLEQSLFRDHFGPNGGPSVCLRRLKVLRDMSCTFDTFCFYPGLTFNCKMESIKLPGNSSQLSQFQ